MLSKVYQRVLGGLRPLYALGVENDPLVLVDVGVLPLDLSGDGDPLPLFQGAGLVVLAQKAEEADVLHAAGHGVAPGDEGAAGQLRPGHGLCLVGDGLAHIAVGVFLNVQIPDAVVGVLQVDARGLQGIGEDILYLQLLDRKSVV